MLPILSKLGEMGHGPMKIVVIKKTHNDECPFEPDHHGEKEAYRLPEEHKEKEVIVSAKNLLGG